MEILLIEDNPGDASLIKEMLQESGVPHVLTVIETGERAIDFLKKRSGFASVPTPDFIILDLNLPRVHGFDVLLMVKTDPKLMPIPVVVMTGSLNKDDEMRSLNMGAAGYHLKPSSLVEIDTTSIWLKKRLSPLFLEGGSPSNISAGERDLNRIRPACHAHAKRAVRCRDSRTAYR